MNRRKMSKDLAKIIADNEQERAVAREWWADASLNERLAVFEFINKPYADPVVEVASRMALLAFFMLWEEELTEAQA